MSVRLDGFRIRGFGPFDHELAVDFTTFSATDVLIAICGENGAGKTTALELALPGSMFRATPTRGSLVELATSRDAFLESRIVNGQSWTLRHLVDKQTGKSEALVLDSDGQPVLPDTKVTNFDKWAAKHMPDPEVFFVGMFAPQGASGFAGAKPSERKEVLLRILGPEVQALEQDAELAREQLKIAKAALATLEARIADERGRGGDLAFLESELGRLRGYVDQSRALVAETREKLAAAEAEARLIEALAESQRTTTERGMALSAKLEPARQAVEKIEKQIANNRAVLGDADAIRDAAARLPVLTGEVAAKRAEVDRLDAEVRQHTAAQMAAAEAEAAASQRAQRAERQLQGADAVAAAVAKLPKLRNALKAAEADEARELESLDALRSKRTQGDAERIDALRGTLVEIRGLDGSESDGTVPAKLASERLEADDAEIQLAAELPREVKAQSERVADYAGRRRAAEQAFGSANVLAARAPDVAAAREDLAKARGEMQAAAERRHAAGGDKERALFARDAANADLEQLVAELCAVEPLAAKAEPLANAKTRLAQREAEMAAAQAEVTRLEGELAALPKPEPIPPAPDLARARHMVQEADEQLAVAHRGVAAAEQRLEQAKASAARVLELEGERAAAEAELADWARLAADLGKDGLQAMVIDQAIPELNESANALLHAAFGTRFTIEVRTQSADAKGKRMLETLDVWVIDTGTDQHKGREGLIETFSGGEKTILAEALSLALTQMACRISGVERPTLVRDESAGQLSTTNAPLWMAMLRRAAELIGADRILFVNHERSTWDLADRQIWVGAKA